MPFVTGEALRFLYLCDPTRVVDSDARTVSESLPTIHAEAFRGGTQLIPFDAGWLCVVHEVAMIDGRRRYHRFVGFDATMRLNRVSRPFVFHGPGVEFAAGLAWHPDGRRLVITYGIADGEAWIATVDAGEIRPLLSETPAPPAPAPPPRRRLKISSIS